MTNMRKQAGMTIPSMLVVGLISLLLIKAAMAVVPMYWDDRMLSTVLNKMQASTEIKTNNSPKQLMKIIDDRLSSNNLAIPTGSAIIKTEKTGLTLEWQYERRANWVSNIDIVVSFHHRVEF